MNTADHNPSDSIINKAFHVEQDFQKKVVYYQKSVIHRFPFIFLGLSTFGGVAVFYGFEKIIEQTPFLADKPVHILIMGFVILLLTGALYRKLQ